MPICSIVSNLLGICRSTMAKLPFSFEGTDAKARRLAESEPEVRPTALADLLNVISDVMLRINSSVSSGRQGGPRPGAKMPCTRIVGECLRGYGGRKNLPTPPTATNRTSNMPCDKVPKIFHFLV